MHRPFFSRRGPSLHGHCPASPLLRPHPTTAFAFASCSSPKFPCRTFGKCRPLCPAASTLPESSQQGDVGFTSTETLTTRKHLTRLYVGSSLALRPIPLSGKTPAHRSPFARLAVLIVCRFLYDIAPSAISSAELCLAYLWQFTGNQVAAEQDREGSRLHSDAGARVDETECQCRTKESCVAPGPGRRFPFPSSFSPAPPHPTCYLFPALTRKDGIRRS